MARRLSTSRSLPASTSPGDQFFEVECSCGETVTGTREIQAQTLICPNCGEPLFVLPADCYADATPPPIRSAAPAGSPSEGLIEKLHRLAFWTRLRKSRSSLRGQLGSIARQMGRWVKRRLPPVR